ncbi:MAG: hypothetical protein D6738_12550 [Acidobacteria bacterium]|nr:MAG: hypothetical protein D6738_12550 [Acidobacteriota bacterium]
MFRPFLADAKVVNPHARVIGLTATPFRMKTGTICAPDTILNEVCYEVGVRELIVRGFLCPLRTKAGTARADTSGLHVRAGEYVAGEVEDLMDDEALVDAACAEIVELTRDRRSVLIFASGVCHGEHVARVIRERHGAECGFIEGGTPTKERDALIDRFKRGELKYLANVNVLTTGFDAPGIDCVALLRPTLSPGLYYQMCLDMETEVLTRSGWRRCHEVTTGDVVAAFDLASEDIVYVPALEKVHRPLGAGESMYGVVAPHLDIRVTDRHTMVVRGRSRTCLNWQLRTAADVSARRETCTIPVAGRGGNHRRDAAITDAEVEFIGWFLTDGYMNRGKGTVTISQSAAKFADEVRRVLAACGLGFREYVLARASGLTDYADGVQFVIPRGEGRGENAGLPGWERLKPWLDKDVPPVFDTLSRRQFAVLLRAMDLGNGKNGGAATRVMAIACGCRQRLADRIQQLAIERGYRCNIARIDPKPSGWNRSPQPQWMIYIKPQRTAYIGGTRVDRNDLVPQRCRLQPVAHQRNEWVWCLTTEKGTLVTRRRGKVAIVGNCGRGFRLAPGKSECLVLDYGGNVLRHGPVDAIRLRDRETGGGEAPAKECPQCHALIAAGYQTCPECGHQFPEPNRRQHEATASTEGILSGQTTRSEERVSDVSYHVHHKRDDPDAPPTMRVEYRLGFNR